MLQLTEERAGSPGRSTWGGTGLMFGETFDKRLVNRCEPNDLRFTPQIDVGF
ncbi:hypothetical protein NDI43_13075 [Microcoleus vaginatus GB2-A3]|uniref:hypothetical protein n=1 Tax=Microcoleus vaginatus TaxID=119532 RepID=UPI0032AB4089